MSKSILICGAGVIGLTTAIRLLEAGYKVAIVASHLPGDPLSVQYTSSAAGAHHLSFAANNDQRQHMLDRRTFDVLWEEEEKEGDQSGLMKIRQIEYYGNKEEKHIDFFEGHPDFRVCSPAELPSGVHHAVSFTTVTIDTAAYLTKLKTRFETLGGTLTRATFSSLSDALHYGPNDTDLCAVINCTGLGSLRLTDVRDEKMHPIRGQVLVLNAPWVKEGRTLQVDRENGPERTYVIPRRSGEVVIGGTREVNDWTAEPRPKTTEDIKRRAIKLMPELAPEAARSNGRVPQPEDLNPIVVREVVGFRPGRQGGIRLEMGEDTLTVQEGGRKIPVLHNYGHSGAGWQSSWGCAEEIVKLVKAL